MSGVGVADVVAHVSDAAFGRPLVMNVLRGHVVEAMVDLALRPDWRWCAADYAGWDFERADGVRVEVKQSAARQSWEPAFGGKVCPRFDVRERTGWWDGADWVPSHGRAAHLYLFCYNGRADEDADHRNPDQWEFFVASAGDLPTGKSIGINRVRALTPTLSFSDLKQQVRSAADKLAR